MHVTPSKKSVLFQVFLLALVLSTTFAKAQKSGWELGNELFQQGKYADAAALYERAMTEANEFKESADLRYSLALAHFKARNFDEAFKRAQEALKLEGSDPEKLKPIIALSSFNVKKPNWANAYTQVEDYATDSGKHQLLLNYGRTAMQAGENTHAMKAFNRMLELEPNNLPVRRTMAALAMKANKLDDAEAQYVALLEQQPNDVDLLQNLAKLNHMQKDWDEVLNYADRGLELNATDGEMLKLKGATALRLKRWSSAREAYIKLFEAERNPEFASLVGQTFDQQKRYSQAARYYQQALDISGDDCTTLLRLAKAKELQGVNTDDGKIAIFEDSKAVYEKAAGVCGEGEASEGVSRLTDRIERIRLIEE